MVFILGITLNTLEIVSLVYAKRTKLPFDISLISLAASDLMLAVTIVPIGILPNFLHTSAKWVWYYKLSLSCTYASSLSSALHMLFIAIQRLIAVLYPLKLTIWMTRKHCSITICVLWLVSTACSVISVESIAFQKFLMYSPLISASAIVICYISINIKMLKRKRLGVSGQSLQSIHVLAYSICITAIFMICTFPYTFYGILQLHGIVRGAFPIYALHLFYVQVILDPVVYFFSHIWKKNRCVMCSRGCHCCSSKAVSAQQND